MLVLALTGLALTAVLVVLVRRRRAEAVRTATAGTPDFARTLSAHFVQPPPDAGPVDDAPHGGPTTGPVATEVEFLAQVSPEQTTGVWAQRRSPYAPSRPDVERIALPDDDDDPEIAWRPEEGSIARTRGTTPLARSARVSTTGRIGLSDDGGAVSWHPGPDRP